MPTRDLTLPDRRTLRVWVSGELPRFTLLYHPGTPAGVTPEPEIVTACERAGVGLVVLARPGYAGSTRLPGRTVVDVVADSDAALSQLGAGEVVTLGWSGGGPHALACAALLPACRAAVSLAGVGPDDAPGVDLDAGMAPDNVEEFAAARDGEATLRPWLEAAAAVMTAAGPDELIAAMGELLPPVDRASLTPVRAEQFAASTREALVAGVDGWLDDDLAFIRPWGFDVSDIFVPVAVWQGELDTMVPAAHGRWLAAHLPDARPHLTAGDGHLSIGYGHLDEIVADLVGLAG